MTKIHKKVVRLTIFFLLAFRFSPPTVGWAHARNASFFVILRNFSYFCKLKLTNKTPLVF